MSVQSEINRIVSAVADAYDEVDAKGGTMPASETVDNLADAIASIPSGGTDVSDTTATAGDVLAGAEFYNSSGVKTVGTIPVITSGEDTAIITSVNDQIEIEEGYHDGMGSVFIQRSDVLKLIPGNIKSGVTVLGVSGSLTPGTDVSDTTAVAGDVLESKDFYLADGTKTTGTMADHSGAQRLGTKSSSTNYMGLYPNSPGYYDTSSRIVLAKADFGNATASDVVKGKTFASSSGWDVVGTKKNVQAYHGMATVNATSYTATTVTLTCAVAGTYKVSWTGCRSGTSGTYGSRLYVNGSAKTSAVTTFDSTNTRWQCVNQTGVTLAANDVLVIRCRSNSTTTYMSVGNLIIEQTA